jgi:hypothetical protein
MWLRNFLLKPYLNHEELIELLAIPLGDQRTVAKWLVNEAREEEHIAPKKMEQMSQ